MPGELLAQRRDDLEREPLLLVPGAPQQLAQWRRGQLLRRRAIEGVSVNRLDDVGEMNLAKMLFHFLATAESLRLRHIQTGEFGFPALLFDPLFDDGLVLHDFHLRLVHLEGHSRKTLAVQLAQFVLVIVIVRRAENGAAETALCDKRVRAFRRIGRRALRLVKRVEVFSRHVIDGVRLGKPERVVQIANPKRLGRLAIRLFHDAKRDVIAVGFFQDQMGDVENRIGATGQFDLARQRFKALLLRREVEGDLRQRLVRFASFLAARLIVTALPFATRRAGARAARPALVARPSVTAVWTARHPGTVLAAVSSARTGLFAAFVFRKPIGVRRLLRPGRQELQFQLFQIQTGVRRIAHVITSLARGYNAPRTKRTGTMDWLQAECKCPVEGPGAYGTMLLEEGERDRPGRSVRRLAEQLVQQIPFTIWSVWASGAGPSA